MSGSQAVTKWCVGGKAAVHHYVSPRGKFENTAVRIGVIGPGAMGEALAARWLRAGHDLVLTGRTAAKAAALAAKLGTKHGSLADTVAHGDVILLAVRHEGVYATLRDAGAERGAFRGKTIIDCNNPVEVERFTLVTHGMESMAEGIQEMADGAAVVKAFNLCHATVWQMQPLHFDGRPLGVPYCGDATDSKVAVRKLIADLGCRPIDIGPLHRARHLEAMAAIVIGLLFGGYDAHTVFNLITTTDAT